MNSINDNFIESHLAITRETYERAKAEGLYAKPQSTDAPMEIKVHETLREEDLWKILLMVGAPYNWHLRDQYNNPVKLERILAAFDDPRARFVEFKVNGVTVGGTVLANVQEREKVNNVRSLYRVHEDQSADNMAERNVTADDASSAGEIYKIGFIDGQSWGQENHTGKKFGPHFLPKVFELMMASPDTEVTSNITETTTEGVKTYKGLGYGNVYLNTRDSNHGGVLRFYSRLRMGFLGGRTRANDLVSARRLERTLVQRGMIKDDKILGIIPVDRFFKRPRTKEASIEFFDFSDVAHGRGPVWFHDDTRETLERLVMTSATNRGLSRPHFGHLMTLIGGKVKGALIFERTEDSTQPRPIGYYAYSDAHDRKGRPVVIMHEVYAVEGRRLEDVAEAIYARVARESKAGRILLNVAEDDDVGQEMLQHAAHLGARTPPGVISLDATPLLSRDFSHAALNTRPIEKADVDKLKTLKTNSGSTLLDQHFDYDALPEDVRGTILVSCEDEEGKKPIALTIVSFDASLVTTQERLVNSHTRSPAETSEELRISVIESVMKYINSPRSPLYDDLGLTGQPTAAHWNVSRNGDNDRISDYFRILTDQEGAFRLSEVKPERSHAAFSNGVVEAFERLGANAEEQEGPQKGRILSFPIRVPANGRRAAVPHEPRDEDYSMNGSLPPQRQQAHSSAGGPVLPPARAATTARQPH